ncbi:hypothetical protein [Saguinine gammaherpesvirus 1]|uniref:Uncharacterized protein n=1 Tax=Saguinine gammaherpesvirus 1 TaxID=2169901 RepID=A0A9Q8QXX3_9GAMA|nr:hypothetical protein [Saguinine gammaherpesvirus 1]
MSHWFLLLICGLNSHNTETLLPVAYPHKCQVLSRGLNFHKKNLFIDMWLKQPSVIHKLHYMFLKIFSLLGKDTRTREAF